MTQQSLLMLGEYGFDDCTKEAKEALVIIRRFDIGGRVNMSFSVHYPMLDRQWY
ncbi:MAG: hypothetical protein GX786_06930 [Clostridiales bacterium]|nr:hypothetical protein [Clostridiales bacterium]